MAISNQRIVANASDDSIPLANRTLPMPACPELEQALLEANVQTLLMVYVHLTHDEAMLEQFKAHIHPPSAQAPNA